MESRVQGKRVIVRDVLGRLLARVVVEHDAAAVYVTDEEHYRELLMGAEVTPIGFPKADVFEYDEGALADPGQLRPWTEAA